MKQASIQIVQHDWAADQNTEGYSCDFTQLIKLYKKVPMPSTSHSLQFVIVVCVSP